MDPSTSPDRSTPEPIPEVEEVVEPGDAVLSASAQDDAYQEVEDRIRYRRMAAKDGNERLNAYAAVLTALFPFLGKPDADDHFLRAGELDSETDRELRLALASIFTDINLIASRPGLLAEVGE